MINNMIQFKFRQNPVRLPAEIDNSYDVSWFRVEGAEVVSFNPPDLVLSGAEIGRIYTLTFNPEPVPIRSTADISKAVRCLELLQGFKQHRLIYDPIDDLTTYSPIENLNSTIENYRFDSIQERNDNVIFTQNKSFEPIHPENQQYIHVKTNTPDLKLYDGTDLHDPILTEEGYYVFENPVYQSSDLKGLYLVNS